MKVTVLLENHPKRGRGLWKLNTSLLQDNEYINLIKTTIQEGKLDTVHLQDQYLAWDYLKCRIRTESISYSIKKKKKQHEYIKTLSSKLILLEEEIATTPSSHTLEEYKSVKAEIEEHYEQKAKGTLIRSRCKLINEYEKPTKYFLNLEKTRQKTMQIQALNINGQRINKASEILLAQKNFYHNLFSSTEADFNMSQE